MSSRGSVCNALAIGGLDPGGGAGIAADLRAFAKAGAFGCAAVAVITVQSTDKMLAAKAVESKLLIAQVREVLRAQNVRAIKVGALGSRANVNALSEFLRRDACGIPVVLDTVLQPTRGTARLFDSVAIAALRDNLMGSVDLVTANIDEAAVITGVRVRDRDSAMRAAEMMLASGAFAVLIKGGHLREQDTASDYLLTRFRFAELVSPRLPRLNVHGSGCTLASLIAGRLAVESTHARPSEQRFTKTYEKTLVNAIKHSKKAHHAWLKKAISVGVGQRVLP